VLLALVFAFLAPLPPRPAAAQAGGSKGSLDAQSAVTPVDPESAPRPESRAVRIDTPIVVDGFLDEPAWQQADTITGFIQNKPDPGYPATERTEVWIVYDERKLYVGAMLYDSEPDRITAHSLKREFNSGDEDVFGVVLDTFLDRRNGFMFGVNPHGAFRDAQVFDLGRDLNFDWEGVVERVGRINDEGWVVEMAIPFTTLRFNPTEGEQSWGLNFVRRIRRKGEDVFWAPLDRRFALFRSDQGGTLHGLSGLESGRNLSIKPYALAGTQRGLITGGADETELDGGFDVKWGLTRRLTLDLTFRTDFSQVEVDQEQVNLTRFSLFFPEKRQFFLENAGIFEFGDVPERGYRLGAGLADFRLFHSRRIGLFEGRPIPIHGGARMTGRIGGVQVGVLNMQTQATDVAPAENFSVARVRHTFFDAVQVGGMFTNRQITGTTTETRYNNSYGADVIVHMWQNLVIHSYLAGTSGRGTGENNTAARISAAWRGQLWDVSALYRTIGDSFNPEVGFVRRRGIRHSYATVGVHPQPDWRLVQELNPYVELHYFTNQASVLETRTATAGLNVDFLDRSRLTVTASDHFERLFGDFEVVPGAVIPVGSYDFAEGSVQYQSSRGRKLSGLVRLASGGFFSGTRRSALAGALWRPSHHFSLELNAEYNDIEIDGESFVADVYGARMEYGYSTRLFGSAFVQYNGASDEFVTNLRVNFIHAPLSDVFFVYIERRIAASWALLDRQVALKVTKLFQF
jgi:hypothetical protein